MMQFKVVSGGQSLICPPGGTSSLHYVFALSGSDSEKTFSIIKDRKEYKNSASRASWLDTALEELEGVDGEAAEEDLPKPSLSAKATAQRIISSLAYMGLPQPSIYPTEKHEIAIFFRHRASGVLIHCGSRGEGVCFASFAGKNRRARYDDARDLPDDFVKEQLRHLLVVP